MGRHGYSPERAPCARESITCDVLTEHGDILTCSSKALSEILPKSANATYDGLHMHIKRAVCSSTLSSQCSLALPFTCLRGAGGQQGLGLAGAAQRSFQRVCVKR